MKDISRQPSGEALWRRLILVQGHRRSGSTWLAAVLGTAPETSLIPYEPLWLVKQPDTEFTEDIRNRRRSGGWLFRFDPDQQQYQEHAAMIRGHVEALVRHYFHGPVDTLVIKEPHPNWMPLIKGALQPDHMVYLDRHPLGILNSYEISGLYEGWETADEWQKFLNDIRPLDPPFISRFERISHPAKRVAIMAYMARKLCLEAASDTGHTVVEYEPLCLNPYAGFKQIFTDLGFNWNKETQEQLRRLVDPAGQDETGFIAVHKRSYDRAYAWRSEMAPHLIHSILRLMEDIPWMMDQAEASAPVSVKEGVSGVKVYSHRRLKWLRRFGPRAVLRSL